MHSPIMSAYDDLLKRITVFINRYYTVRLLKGLFLSVGLGIGLFLFLITLEFFFRFNSLTRGLLLSFFVITSGWFVLLNVINPLLRLLHWAKAMSHRNAAVQLGQYFDGISDKILSAIELKEKQYPGESAALIVAAVEQKAIDLRLFPIERALSLNKSFKYLKYGVFPILLFAMAYFAVPDLVIGGSERLVNYQKEFAIQAPFQFKVDISQFEVVKGKDAPISVSLNGESLPESVTVEWNGEPFRMSAEGKGAFAYLFRNVQKGGNIRFLAAGYSSDVWELKVMPNPKVIEVSAEIDYPDYTGKPDEVVTNPLHLSLPEGSNYTL
ncbi:MAG: hypothetical protein KDC37_04030, partial [Flavobacteriales bacterium]|nr:hypothetical protein [Flavobacteriales bacterium]